MQIVWRSRPVHSNFVGQMDLEEGDLLDCMFGQCTGYRPCCRTVMACHCSCGCDGSIFRCCMDLVKGRSTKGADQAVTVTVTFDLVCTNLFRGRCSRQRGAVHGAFTTSHLLLDHKQTDDRMELKMLASDKMSTAMAEYCSYMGLSQEWFELVHNGVVIERDCTVASVRWCELCGRGYGHI